MIAFRRVWSRGVALLTIWDWYWQKLAGTFKKPNQQFTTIFTVIDAFLCGLHMILIIKLVSIRICGVLILCKLCQQLPSSYHGELYAQLSFCWRNCYATVEPRYSEPLKCGHLVLTDVLLQCIPINSRTLYRSVPLIRPLRKYTPPLFTAKVPA